VATALVKPPALRPGDLIAAVAPASPFEHVLAWSGLGWLAQRYRVRFDRTLFTRRGYLAGDDARRRDELLGALSDPAVRAIVAVRGGYGANRFVHALDWSLLARDPKWIVGFSDITALHVEAARAGVASIHGGHVTMLGRADARMRSSFIDVLEYPSSARVFECLEPLVPGAATGPLHGGNLALLHACAAAGRLALPPGCILLLEDVTERPYRIDRMLTTLLVGGHFASVSGVVLGEFTQCDPGPDGVTVMDVLRDRLGDLGVPVVAGAPIGHGLRNEPVVLGALASIDARGTSARFTVGEG
jgi:muramoyltetrapeptide carboxypeptidase